MKKPFLLTFIIIFHLGALAQVGIGTTVPKGALDINSSTNGFIPPRVSLTATNAAPPVVNPQGGALVAGTIVWNTNTAGTPPNNVVPGLYYWNGSRWVAFAGSGSLDWSLTGNAGTTVGANFIGTTDSNDFAINTNNTERARVLSNGHVLVNTTTNDATTGANNVFEVLASTPGDDAISGYASGNTQAAGVYGSMSGNWGYGVRGFTDKQASSAISGLNTHSGGCAINGAGGNAAEYYDTSSGVTGNGIFTGVAGIAQQAQGVGVRGTGNFFLNNIAPTVGAGVAGTGTQAGVFGYADNLTGMKHGGIFTSEHGSRFSNLDNPYAYLAGSNGTLVYGGYFDANQDVTNNGTGNNQGEDYAYVGVVNGNTTYKILGNGSVSTIVKDENNERRILFAPEAPEILFQDYGVGKLVNGIASIKLDPVLTKNLFVDATHPLKVFIQLEGDCNGVYVTDKTAAGFTVRELKNGKSNTPFSWQIIANRADTTDDNGKILSKHVDVRFPIGPGPLKHDELRSQKPIKNDQPKNDK